MEEEKLAILTELQDQDEDRKKEHDDDDPKDGLNSGSFHAGSLPIDIVRPGSFRDNSVTQ